MVSKFTGNNCLNQFFQDGKWWFLVESFLVRLISWQSSIILTTVPPLKGNMAVLWDIHQYFISFFLWWVYLLVGCGFTSKQSKILVAHNKRHFLLTGLGFGRSSAVAPLGFAAGADQCHILSNQEFGGSSNSSWGTVFLLDSMSAKQRESTNCS